MINNPIMARVLPVAGNHSDVGVLPLIVVWVCVLTISLSGCDGVAGDSTESKPAVVPPQRVNVIRIQKEDNAYQTSSYYGRLQPKLTSRLGFAAPGRIATILVDVGQTVTAGQTLAQLELQTIQAQLASIENAIDDNRTKLASLNQNDFQPAETVGRAQQIKSVNAKIAELQTQQKTIEAQIESSTISAPFAGTVAHRHANAGEVVQAGRVILELADTSNPQLFVAVDAEIVDALQVGRKLKAVVDDSRVMVQVVAIAPTLNRSTRTQTVILEPAEKLSAAGWKVGDVAEIRFWTPSGQSGFWVPQKSLHRQPSGLWSVLAVAGPANEQIVVRRTVEVLLIEDGQALVNGSLSESDRIIIDGAHRVVPSQRVFATETDSPVAPLPAETVETRS